MFYYLNSNIKYLRKKSGMTMSDLSIELEISKNSLANFEGGQYNTSLEVLDKLHNIFKVSLDDLVYKDLTKND